MDRFPLGRTVATPGALAALGADPRQLLAILARHRAGDWGDLGEADRRENEFSLAHGFRLLSAYRLASGARVWIITEADRSATTILLPSEY
jgi:hypothetical protein